MNIRSPFEHDAEFFIDAKAGSVRNGTNKPSWLFYLADASVVARKSRNK